MDHQVNEKIESTDNTSLYLSKLTQQTGIDSLKSNQADFSLFANPLPVNSLPSSAWDSIAQLHPSLNNHTNEYSDNGHQSSDVGSPPIENKLPIERQLFPKEERSAEDEWFVIPPADITKIQPLPPVIKAKKRAPTDRLKILESLLKMSGRSIKQRFKCYLDLGCGNGDIFSTNLEYLNPQQGYCADIHNNHLPRFIQIVNNKIPLPNNSVDLITCHVAIHHFKKPDLMINEMKRIMMPDGYLFIREHDVTSEELNDVTAYLDLLHMMELIRHAKPITRQIQTTFYRRYWSKEELSKLLNSVGFEEIGFQRYVKRYNPQRLYHSLYFFNPSLAHDEIRDNLSLPKDAKYSSEKNNLVLWLQSDSKRRFFTRKKDDRISDISGTGRTCISVFSSKNGNQPEPIKSPRRRINSKKKYHDMGERSYYHWFCDTLRKKLKLDGKVLENIIKRSKDDLHFYQQIFNLIHPDFDYCSINPSSSLYLDSPRRYQHGRPRSRSSPNRDRPNTNKTRSTPSETPRWFGSSTNHHRIGQSADAGYLDLCRRARLMSESSSASDELPRAPATSSHERQRRGISGENDYTPSDRHFFGQRVNNQRYSRNKTKKWVIKKT